MINFNLQEFFVRNHLEFHLLEKLRYVVSTKQEHWLAIIWSLKELQEQSMVSQNFNKSLFNY